MSYKFKNGIIYIFSHYFSKIKIDPSELLAIERRLTLYNVIILIKSVVNKDENHYYYNIYLEILASISWKIIMKGIS